jgi:tRNA A-37 threonylcarbamoyl transferase component Bud32
MDAIKGTRQKPWFHREEAMQASSEPSASLRHQRTESASTSTAIFEIIRGNTHVLLPRARNPRWAITLDNSDVYRRSFDLYQPAIWSGKLLKWVLKNLYWYFKCFGKGVSITNIREFIDAEGPYSISFGRSLGRSTDDQKATVLLFRNDQPYAYAKIGFTQRSRALVDNEARTLSMLSNLKLGFQVPQVLRYEQREAFNVLTQSTKPHLFPAPVKITPEVIKIVEEISNIESTGDAVFSHGDFTPWNMRLTECGDYFVFDWEYAGLREKEYDLKSLRHQIDSVNAAGGISMTLRGFTAFKKQKRI